MLFDCIGSKLSVTSIYCESSEEREILRQVAKLLVNWLEQDSSRYGLVNLLVVIAATIQIDSLPSNLKDLMLHHNTQVSRAAVILQLAERGIGQEQMNKIAQEVIDICAHDHRRVLAALEIYENHQSENSFGLLFLEKLLAGLPSLSVQEKRNITRILTELLARRVASLSDRQIWERLHLPIGLFGLIRN